VHADDDFHLSYSTMWYHSTYIHPGEMSITIGSEYDWQHLYNHFSRYFEYMLYCNLFNIRKCFDTNNWQIFSLLPYYVNAVI